MCHGGSGAEVAAGDSDLRLVALQLGRRFVFNTGNHECDRAAVWQRKGDSAGVRRARRSLLPVHTAQMQCWLTRQTSDIELNAGLVHSNLYAGRPVALARHADKKSDSPSRIFLDAQLLKGGTGRPTLVCRSFD